MPFKISGSRMKVSWRALRLELGSPEGVRLSGLTWVKPVQVEGSQDVKHLVN